MNYITLITMCFLLLCLLRIRITHLAEVFSIVCFIPNIPLMFMFSFVLESSIVGTKKAKGVLIEEVHLTRININRKNRCVAKQSIFFYCPIHALFKHLIYESKAAVTALFCKPELSYLCCLCFYRYICC